jgi:nitric oxide reductase subunit B
MIKLRDSISAILLNKRYWFVHFWIVSLISVFGLWYLGDATYESAPPLTDFKINESVVFSKQQIQHGEEIFHLRGLMNYGSFWGDGAERGPDFTAEALHLTMVNMRAFYESKIPKPTQADRDAIAARVKRELHQNTWDAKADVITMNEAQVFAYSKVVEHYTRMFTDSKYPGAFYPNNYISDPQQLRDLASFFYWGGWVASTNRPGQNYTYTHNWPYEPEAGNQPTRETYVWSFISVFALFVGIMIVLYVYGQMKTVKDNPFGDVAREDALLTTPDLENQYVRPTQKLTYKFFALAMVVFGLQVLAGILGALNFADPFAATIMGVLPFNILRSYHTLFQIYWFFMCWVGYTIFFLPRLSEIPKFQPQLINLLFNICLWVGLGGLFGIYLGQMGIITGPWAYWFGSQGWEFMELGRFFQILLLAGFSLWIFIIYRGVKPWITKKTFWSVPAWLLWGSGIMVLFLFFGLFTTPDTNFAIADFWRWMVVHMWVEVTFEVFTTVIVGYIMVQMGLITKPMAERVIYLAVILFLITATVGVAHNFYWIAKPTGVIALGSVFSTLQILPLLLLTLDAWKLRKEGKSGWYNHYTGGQQHLMDGVWMFILAVNFWNIFGAGVFGSLINLPIINYFEHATYVTGNHAHAAMFGVKGNIALAGMLFCCQHMIKNEWWNPKLIKWVFWTLNIGVALMMFMSLFPAGLYQLYTMFDAGFWLARSHEIVTGPTFTMFVWLRSVGSIVFSIGVVLLNWFILSRIFFLKDETRPTNDSWANHENDWKTE